MQTFINRPTISCCSSRPCDSVPRDIWGPAWTLPLSSLFLLKIQQSSCLFTQWIKMSPGPVGMAQLLQRAGVPNTHVGHLTTTYITPAPEHSTLSSGLCSTTHTCQTHKHIINKNKNVPCLPRLSLFMTWHRSDKIRRFISQGCCENRNEHISENSIRHAVEFLKC